MAIKIIKTAALITAALLVLMTVAALVLGNRVERIIMAAANNRMSVAIETSSARLSFIRKFPNATLLLNDITIFSSNTFNTEEFTTTDTDTLLYASQVSIQFSIADIISRKYIISGAGIRNGRLNILTDASGKGNYGTTHTAGTTGSENSFDLNLDRVTLDNIAVAYNNPSAGINIAGNIEKGKLSTRISKGRMLLHAETDAVITRLVQKDFTLNSNLSAGINVNLEKTENGLTISAGKLFVEGISLELAGSVSSENKIDFTLAGNKIDIARTRRYLPQKYSDIIKQYALKGTITVNASVKGKISETENPHIELDFTFENGAATNSAAKVTAGNIYVKGTFSNGTRNTKNTSVITIPAFSATIGSGNTDAKLKITNLGKPVADIELKGSIYPEELRRFFTLTRMPHMAGYCDIDLKLKAPLPPFDTLFAINILKQKPAGTATLHGITVSATGAMPIPTDISGKLTFAQNITASNLTFMYANQKTTLSGTFENLPQWLAQNATTMNADADIHFEKLSAEILKPLRNNKNPEAGTFTMPHNISLNLRITADSLLHNRLPAAGAQAAIVYRTGLLTFSSLGIKTLGGSISGNGFVMQDAAGNFTSKGIFDINNLGIKQTFAAFSNFGQKFITAENLDGNFTGTVTLLLPASPAFKINTGAVTAEGRFAISSGSLVNFEPVKKLSSFIELSELENIRFDKLENDFLISNSTLSIPQMEVTSSAADFSINGTHNFNGNFEYHIRTRLSELLSRKRKNSRTVTEFGAVEDDGLGRTSIFLIAQNSGNATKISYDMRAARNTVRTGIKTERQNIRTILNQEYGMFRNDTVPPAQKPAETKPRFRIEWE